jgi:ribonuclease T1
MSMIDVPAPRSALPVLATARLFAVSLCLLAGIATTSLARSVPEELPEVTLAVLPNEAQEVYARIGKGGPFRYERDGIAFGNRERLLPSKPRGYYHEYTVSTPGARNRGARRVICGGPKTAPDVCYYTGDHYQSFQRIRE